MPLLAVLDETAHGVLDDSLKTLYVQNTETKEFHLDIAPDEAAKLAHHQRTQLEAKKADLSRVHGEKSAIATKLKPFEDLGMSIDEIKTALEGKQPKEVRELLEKFEADKEALRNSFEEPLTKALAAKKTLEAQVQRSLAASKISELIATFELDPETAPANLERYIRVVPKQEGSEEYTVKVFDEVGQPALVAGQEMTPDQLINSWKEGKKFQKMFLANNAGGGGSTNRMGGQAKQDFSKLSATERLKAGHREGAK